MLEANRACSFSLKSYFSSFSNIAHLSDFEKKVQGNSNADFLFGRIMERWSSKGVLEFT